MKLESNISTKKLYNLINQFVYVKLKCKHDQSCKKLEGFLITIDPVTLSVVLINLSNEETKYITIILEEDIIEIDRSGDSTIKFNFDIDHILNYDQVEKSTWEIQRKREKLVDWLKINHLPLELKHLKNELNEEMICINIMSTVLIKPPYGVDECESKNQLILEKIRQLVSKV